MPTTSPTTSFIKQLYADPFRHWTPDELIAIGLGRPMICDPGTCWSYAHTNFVILGKVLEKAAGAASRRPHPRRHSRAARAQGHAERADRDHPGAGAARLRRRARQVRGIDLLESVMDARAWRDHDVEHRRHLEERGGDRGGDAAVARFAQAAARAAHREVQAVERHELLRLRRVSSSTIGSCRTRPSPAMPRP